MKNLFSFLFLSFRFKHNFNGLVTAASDGKPLVFASVIADNDTKTITDVMVNLQSLKSINSFSVHLHREKK
jgi:hypothetical protein